MGSSHVRNPGHLLIPSSGPASRAAFEFRAALSVFRGWGYKDLKRLHDKFGSVVRVAPNSLSFNTAQAWKGDSVFLPSLLPRLMASCCRRHLWSKIRSDRAWQGSILLRLPPRGSIRYVLASFGWHLLTQPVASQPDHTRLRKHFVHAFSDTALLDQEPLLTQYFDLLITRLKEQVSGPCNGRVNILAYYNFTTFDIIGYSVRPIQSPETSPDINHRHFMFGEPFGCLQRGEYHPWIR